jgi:hypothetical protein
VPFDEIIKKYFLLEATIFGVNTNDRMIIILYLKFFRMYFKTLLFLAMAAFSVQLSAQQECECPLDYNPVCATDSLGSYFEFPNACWADCLGFTVVADTTLCNAGNPWGDCGCTVMDSIYVCAEDSLGNIFSVPSTCLALCWGLTIVDNAECNSNPWNDCNCALTYDPVCAVDSTGYYFEFSNACFAVCYGFEVVTDTTLCNITNPWEDCNCAEIYDPVCAIDAVGNYIEFPNACYAACFGMELVTDSTLCDLTPWNDCTCEINPEEPFVCAVDSLGHPCYVPNACFAACWGLTLTVDSICAVEEIDPEIDWQVMACIDSIEITENTTFQQALLLISTSCGLELPDCIVNAPIFDTDSAFIQYIISNCDGQFGFNGNTTGSNVMNLFNTLTSNTLSGTSKTNVFDTNISLIANPVSEQLTVTLMDINGQNIFKDQITVREGKQSFTKDVSQLRSGIYLLSLTSGKSYQTVKLVITK